MRYFLKRMLAILLVAVMAASMLGLDSSAANQNSRTAESADTASDESGTSSDTETEAADGITRVEWLQELITLFELSVDEDNYPEHGFSDVDSTSEYYDIVYTAAEYGFLPVEAGQAVYPEKAATRQFVAQTLNFGLGIQNDTEEYTFSDSEDCSDPDSAQVAVDRGWFKLDSGNFLPEQAVVSEEVTVILEDAKAILQEAEVDENYNSEYKFADWVVVFPEDEEVTIDENDVVTITNSDVSLSEGDTFVVWPAEIPAFYVADSITTSGNIQTITTSEANVDEALLDVDASGSIDVDLEEFEGADGFDVEYIETEAQARSAIQTYGISVKNGSVIATKNFTVGKGLKVGFTCNLSNLKLNHKESGKSSYYISVSGNYTVTSSVTLDMIEAANGSSSITIGTVPVAGVGKVTISLDLALNGEIAYTYEGKFEVGMQKLSSGGVSFKKNFKKTSFYSDIEAQATVAVKVSFGVDVYFANGNIYATTGLDSKFLSHEYNDGESPNKCSSLSAWWFTKIGYSAQIGIGRFAKSYSDSMYIYDAENSPVQLYFHWEDGVRVYSCARGEYGYFTPFNSRYGGSSYGGGTSSGTGSDGSVFVLYTYTLDEDNNATITGYNGNAKVLMIPETIDGYTVTAIGESTFKNNTSLIYVSIPDTVTSIKSYAFSNCTNLNEVHLSSALKTMGTQAFSYCTS
ncbi:MAG: leucine-rich repeat domain-containing protein, partial [Lachnospiraceae bacterium]